MPSRLRFTVSDGREGCTLREDCDRPSEATLRDRRRHGGRSAFQPASWVTRMQHWRLRHGLGGDARAAIAGLDVLDLPLERRSRSDTKPADKVLDRLRASTSDGEVKSGRQRSATGIPRRPACDLHRLAEVARVGQLEVSRARDSGRATTWKGCDQLAVAVEAGLIPQMRRITSRFVLLIASAAIAPLVALRCSSRSVGFRPARE